MRTFKHKTLGRVAEQRGSKGDIRGFYYEIMVGTGAESYRTTIVSELIENSNDREEVIEKDWIYELVQFIKLTRVTEDTQEKEYREYIEKHMPRISAEELENIYDMSKDMPRPKIIFEMKKLLRSKGLLAD